MVLGWGSRSRQMTAETAAAPSSNLSQTAISTGALAAAASQSGQTPRSVFAGLPLMFEPNLGQANLDAADPRVKFVARGSGYSLMLGSEGAILNLRSANQSQSPAKHAAGTARVESVRMKLAGSNPNATLTGSNLLPGTSNYILGNDPAKWRQGVPQFARVRYENVYPGINLVFYGNQGRLEYDFQVAPGSDPSQAELDFDGAKGLELKDGALVIKQEGSDVRLEAPRVYQEIAGQQQPVEGRFELRGANRVGFAIGSYDRSRELVIDPVLAFSTYFGGTGDELATSVAVDGSGNIYIAGSTTSANLPTVTGVYQTTLEGTQNVYIAKITPPLGSSAPILQYVTYLGGDGTDTPVGIGVDAAFNPFVAGTTTSTNFPTTLTAYQQTPEAGSAGTQHVFVTELSSTNGVANALQYSTYLSGNGDDVASGMTVDAHANVFVTGTTTSSDTATPTVQFPASTVPQALAFQNIPRSSIQFFVTKVNTQAPRTGSIAYSTYFGGGNFDTTTPIAVGGGIAVDTNGNVYFSGTTNFTYTGCAGCSTTDFPILNAYQPCLDQAAPTGVFTPPCQNTSTTSNSDAFVAKLNPNAAQGAQLVWSTYLGGSQTDSGTGVAIDTGAANVYLTGTTNSPDVTSLSSFAAYQHCLDSPSIAAGIACPTLSNPAPNDAFVARLSNPATITTTTPVSLTYFSYLGGSSDEAGQAITVDSAAGALITGWTKSLDFPVFPTPNTIQSTLNGTQDAFVARLNSGAVVGQTTTASWANYYGGSGVDEGTGITLDSNGTVYLAGDTNSSDLQTAVPLSAAAHGTYNGGFDAFVTQLGTAASLSITGTLSLGPNQTYIAAGNQATFTYIITNEGPDLANNITVTDDFSSSITQVALTFVSASATSGTCGGGTTSSTVSCTIGSLQAGSTATVTIVLVPTPSSSGGSAQFNGGTVRATAANNITPVQTSVSANMSDFSIKASPSNFTVAQAGDTAPYEVQLTPNPVYTSNISLTCSGLPTGATCAFSTTTVTLTGTSPGTSSLNITTTARPITTPAASLVTRHFYAIWMIPGLALLGLGNRRGRRRTLGMLLLCVLFGMLLLQPACSKNNTTAPPAGTPAGTWPITIAGTSGSDTKNATVTLTVP